MNAQRQQTQGGEAQTAPPGAALALMQDGREYESLIKNKNLALDLVGEIRVAIGQIQELRKRPLIIYVANVVNRDIKGDISINRHDDLPFSEMVSNTSVGQDGGLDLLVVTPGGEGQQVAQFVAHTRQRARHVSFFIPYMAMSAGTIWATASDEIWMSKTGIVGPIDPQVPGKDGRLLPAQALLTALKDIQERGDRAIKGGRNPDWTDQMLLRNIDAKEIGNAISQSKYSIQLASEYLCRYKFTHWLKHSDGREVTTEDRQATAQRIAESLCSHDQWKTHSHGISREVLHAELKLKIEHTESVVELDRAIRRLWALIYFAFESTNLLKLFLSDNYALIRSEKNR